MTIDANSEEGSFHNGLFRGWIVAACCFCTTLTFGIVYSYGDFFIPLAMEFGWNNATDSTVPAVALLVFSVGSLLAGSIASRVGFRRMCFIGTSLIGTGTLLSAEIQAFSELLILFGVVLPLGIAFITVIGSALIVKWFVKKRGIAAGITTAGAGFGTLAVPPLTESLIAYTNWRDAFIVLGVGFLALLIAISFFMQTPEETGQKPYGWHEMSEEQRATLTNYTLVEALSTRSFWMIYTMFLFGSIGATMFIVEAEPFASTVGISPVTASIALGMLGAGSLIARLLMGALSDRLSRTEGVMISFFAEFISIAALTFVGSSVLGLFLCSFGIGFGYGGYTSDFIALTGDLYGTKWMHKIWSVDSTAFGLGGLIGPIAAGMYFDSFQNYGTIFEIAAVGVFAAFAISLILRREVS